MTTSIRIVQIWQDCNLRGGEPRLRRMLDAAGPTLRAGEVVVFVNRARNRVKVLGAQSGMYYERLEGKQTYDFELRGSKLVDAIGNALGLRLRLPEGAQSINTKKGGKL